MYSKVYCIKVFFDISRFVKIINDILYVAVYLCDYVGMKVLPIIQSVGKDIRQTSVRVSKAGTLGYNIALRTSKIHQAGDLKTIYNITRSVGRKIARETTIDDLPIIAGAIGFILPIPLASPIMLGLGKVAQVLAKTVKKA